MSVKEGKWKKNWTRVVAAVGLVFLAVAIALLIGLLFGIVQGFLVSYLETSYSSYHLQVCSLDVV